MTENTPAQPGGTAGRPGEAAGAPFPAAGPPFPAAGPQPPATAQAPAGSRYGTAAYDPRALGRDLAEPAGLRRLRTLTLVSAAAYVASGIIGLVGTQDEGLIRRTIEAQAGAGLTQDVIDQAVTIARTTGLVTALAVLAIAVVLYAVVLTGLRRARNWARVLGTVLAALGILSTVVSLTGVGVTLEVAPVLGALSIAVGVVYAAVNAWWLLTAYSRDVNAYLRARSGR